MARLQARRAVLVGLALASLSACATREREDSFTPAPRATGRFANIPYASWDDSEPPYRLYPGDVLSVEAPSAPELNRTVTVQADGRISLPLIPPQMVADRSIEDVEAILSRAYASQLLRPDIYVDVRTPTPLKVFVGGEVDKPGVYDMPGDINALQAIIMAGGFKTSGKRSEVIIIRRGADGRAMLRTANLIRGTTDPARASLVPLRRFDIVYVPRTGIAEVGVFVQQYLRDTLPVQLGFSYAVGGTGAVF